MKQVELCAYLVFQYFSFFTPFLLIILWLNIICTFAGFNNVGILGPGVSSLQPNTWSYYEALAQNEDGLTSLAAFSTHIWDDAYKVERTLYFVQTFT